MGDDQARDQRWGPAAGGTLPDDAPPPDFDVEHARRNRARCHGGRQPAPRDTPQARLRRRSASSGYYQWVRAGRPFTLAYPCADLAATLTRYGYTVYAYPDNSHLFAQPPEDHTPFSATGWPGSSPFGWGLADDIMPPSSSRLPSLPALARQLIADRQAGVPGAAWIKYMNWTDEAGTCRNESFEPNRRTSPSSDSGHIHISCRSDFYLSRCAAGYDPVARIHGQPTPTPTPTPKPANRREHQMVHGTLMPDESVEWTPQTVFGGAGALYAFAVDADCDVKIATWTVGNNGWNYGGTDVKPRVFTGGAQTVEVMRVTDSKIRNIRVENTGPGRLAYDWMPVEPMSA